MVMAETSREVGGHQGENKAKIAQVQQVCGGWVGFHVLNGVKGGKYCGGTG